MNCCKKDENQSQEYGAREIIEEKKPAAKQKGPLSHLLMMAVCCGFPLLVLFVLPLIGNAAVRNSISGIAPFLCPIMMMLMIPMMLKNNCCSKGSGDREDGRS